jgi:hypothetical protein
VVFANNRSITPDIAKTISLWPILCIILSSAVTPAAQAEAGPPTPARLSIGLDFSSGDYGLPEDTEMLYLPVTLSYETLPWFFSATVSYLSIDGPGGVIGGGDGGGIVAPGPGHESGGGHNGGGGHDGSGGQGGEGCANKDCISEGANKDGISERGLGDVILRATYALDTLVDTSSLIDLTAKVKLATADEDRELGTGKNDYSLQLDVARAFGKFMPYGTLGYKIMGDPDEFDLNNIWFASAGTDYSINPTLTLGTVFEFSGEPLLPARKA